VRFALGASPGRILRQLLTESLMLSIAGGALGVLFASWMVASIMAFVAANQEGQIPFTPAIDLRVLLFTAAVSILTGILFGLAPAFRGMRVDLMPVMKEGIGGTLARTRGEKRWLTAGNGLVVLQMTLSIVVLACAGLLVRTLQNLKKVDPGFDTRNLLTFRLDPTLLGYSRDGADALYRDLQDRLAAVPGVSSVGYSWFPLLHGYLWTTSFHFPDKPKDKESNMDMLPVGPGFFGAMRIPLLAGRTFGPADFAQAQVIGAALAAERAEAAAKLKAGAQHAASPATPGLAPLPLIVNRAFVHAYFPKREPLGQRFGQTEPDPAKSILRSPGWEIVGIVADAKYNSLRREIQPTGYVPSSGGGVSFVVRTAADPEKFVPQIRAVVGEIDANLPVFQVFTESQQLDNQIFKERLIARLSGFFGVLALLLACVGLYGLVSYEVAGRTREFGIRTALGAERRDVLRMVFSRGLWLASAGAILGLGVALGITRFTRSLLYGVGADDPLTFVGVTILLIGVTLAACYVPARRATRVDPVVALRYE
jgi:predicted permease